MLTKRIILSILVTVLVAFGATMIAYAATYTVSETSAMFKKMYGADLSTESCSTCADSSAKYTSQYPTVAATFYFWEPGYSSIKHWCAYTPGVGVAGVKYMFENNKDEYYEVVLNQANYQQTYRYLGYFEVFPNEGGVLELTNACVPGFACEGRRVYWDKIKLTTGSSSTHDCGP